MIYKIKKIIKMIIPDFILGLYHLFWAFLPALIFGFPSQDIKVVAVTGTKGKTTVVEIINAILEKAGFKTALASSLRFKIGDNSYKNILKMTMPGRGKIQKFLKQAIADKCQWFILEVTSEGIKQFRHLFIDLDVAVFTNLTPEHIERHGSFERYKEAKGKLFKIKSKKKKTHIINVDDKNADYFLNFAADIKIGYGIKFKIKNYPPEADPLASLRSGPLAEKFKINEMFQVSSFGLQDGGVNFVIEGRKFHSPLVGEFNLYNILAAIAFARSQNIDWKIIEESIGGFKEIKGRMQFIDEGQPYAVIIDYAHTPDSLSAVYLALKAGKYRRLICVLGAAGGGRDKWKRKEMGKIAADYCDEIILTNEDPYDENPEEICAQISSGFSHPPTGGPNSYFKILDRKEAIKKAIELAKTGDAVIITGKGSDSWIMDKDGEKIPWNEEEAVRNILQKTDLSLLYRIDDRQFNGRVEF